MDKWLGKGKSYLCRNGNVGIYKGTWRSSASGIIFYLEDEEGHTVGTIKKEDLKNDKKSDT